MISFYEFIIIGGGLFGIVWGIELLCYKIAHDGMKGYIGSWKLDLVKLIT